MISKFVLQSPEPSAQPTSFVFSSITDVSMNTSFTDASPVPTGYLVLRKSGSVVTETPVDGTTYSIGQTIGGATIVHVGAGTSFSNTGLQRCTAYHFAAFSYNGSGDAINYRTGSPLTGNQSTLESEPTAQPTDLVFSNVLYTSMTLSWTHASPQPDKYIVLRRAGTDVANVPADASSYTVGQMIGTATVVYIGNAASFVDSGLTSSTQYFYKIFSFNDSCGTNYFTSSPLSGNKTTPDVLTNALEFDGDDDKCTFQEVSVANFTIELWVKLSALTSGSQKFLKKSTNFYLGRKWVSGTNYRITLAIGGTEVESSTFNMNAGQEYQMVVKKTGTTINYYVDTVPFGSDMLSGTIELDELTVENESGEISIARIFDAPLLTSEITTLYNSGSGNGFDSVPSCIRSWEMNEQSGMTVRDEVNPLDSSKSLTLASSPATPTWTTF